MSVMESIAAPLGDRRRATRVRAIGIVPVTIGRNEGTIIDLSCGGARVRHTGTLRRGYETRLTFQWQRHRVEAIAEVLCSQVESLGNAEHNSTVYVTRIKFTRMADDSYEVLQRVVAAMWNQELQRWISNMRGWSDGPETALSTRRISGSRPFVRCTLVDDAWRKTMSADPTQPADGFVLPATIAAHEVNALCDTYARADADGRLLIRLTAAAVVEEARAAA